jgi:hypothetical protein
MSFSVSMILTYFQILRWTQKCLKDKDGGYLRTRVSLDQAHLHDLTHLNEKKRCVGKTNTRII